VASTPGFQSYFSTRSLHRAKNIQQSQNGGEFGTEWPQLIQRKCPEYALSLKIIEFARQKCRSRSRMHLSTELLYHVVGLCIEITASFGSTDSTGKGALHLQAQDDPSLENQARTTISMLRSGASENSSFDSKIL
jgi:hypothetical protein